MITLSKSGNTVIFEFDENSGYLQNGTIEVPVNSLSLVIDSSDMATFKKAASNDIFVSALVGQFGMTKAELEAWYKENMVGSTGGVDSGTVQTMIDESISGKADSSAVTQEIAAAVSGKVETSAITSAVTSASTDSEIATAKAVYDAIPTVTSAVTSGSTDVITSGGVYEQVGGLKLQQISQAGYDALVSGGTVDSSTLYVII